MEGEYFINVWILHPDGNQKCFRVDVTKEDAVMVYDAISDILDAMDTKDHCQAILHTPGEEIVEEV